MYKPTVETLSQGNAAVKKSARDSALILSKMAENFHKNYGVPLKMAALKIAGGEASRGERTLPQYYYQDLRGNDTIRKEEITPIVTITGTEFGGIVDKKDLQQAGKQYYRNNLQGTKAHNDLLGNIRFEESESETEPRFTGKGLNEMKHTLGDPKKIYAIPYLKDFIRESDVITVSDIQKDKHSKWKRFYYLHSAFKLDGETYYIVTSVVDKGEKNGGLQYYNHNVFTEKQYEKIENAANEALRQDVSSIPGASHQTASSSDFSIYHTNKIYKRKRHTENELHQMVGERANTAMISRLQKAESMEREAAYSEEIWKETGWMRGPDHKWRFEIPDNLDKIDFPKDGKTHTLGEIYDNPALYEAYPELAQKTVRMEDTKSGEDKRTRGAYGYVAEDGSIVIDSSIPADEAKTALVHEIQHSIQAIEGFSRGGNKEMAKKYIYISEDDMRSVRDEYRRESEQDMTSKVIESRAESGLFKKSPDIYGKVIQRQMEQNDMGTIYIDAAKAAETEPGQQALRAAAGSSCP